jgi:hypothetical protein
MNNRTRNEFEHALNIFDSPESKLRLEALKRRFDLYENDAIWLYVVALEHYQRLYEAIPNQLFEMANAERGRMQAEANLIIAQGQDKIAEAAQGAAGVAQAAANQAAAALVQKIDVAVTKRATAAIWGQRAAAMAGALTLAATAAVIAGIVSKPIPDWVIAAYNNHSNPIARLFAMVWNVPAGWVIVLAVGGAAFAFWVEVTVQRRAAYLRNYGDWL